MGVGEENENWWMVGLQEESKICTTQISAGVNLKAVWDGSKGARARN
jgi:hypothetical protein